MKLDQAFEILRRVQQKTGHCDLVVIGSNASLAFAGTAEVPNGMTMSVDLDCYTKADPGRVFDLVDDLGEGSPFHKETGVYLDAVSPYLPTLPDGWEARLIQDTREDISLWFIDPNDTAISKYARGEPRDRRWIKAGLSAGIVSMPRVRLLAKKTTFADPAETAAASTRIEEDVRWLSRPASGRKTPRNGPPFKV